MRTMAMRIIRDYQGTQKRGPSPRHVERREPDQMSRVMFVARAEPSVMVKDHPAPTVGHVALNATIRNFRKHQRPGKKDQNPSPLRGTFAPSRVLLRTMAFRFRFAYLL